MKNWKALSISWVDNMGKTSQIWLLSFGHSYKINVLKSLKGYHPGRKKFNLNDSNEWFRAGNENQFLETLVYSVLKRNEDIALSKQSYDLTIVDRGLQAFIATIISTLAIKLGVDETNAEEYFKNWLSNRWLDCQFSDVEDIKVILQCSTNIDEQIHTTLSRSENWENAQERLRYIEYQKILNNQINKQLANSANNKIYVTRPIVDIQNDIRGILCDNGMERFMPIGENIKRLVWIGGMSESGKSTVWEYLHDNGFVRTKVKYFAELINELIPNADELSPEEFATRLMLELHKFSKAHNHIDQISIESIRDPKVFGFMKILLGDRFHMLYVETDRQNAISRTALEKNISLDKATEEIMQKDADKALLNTNGIREIADSIIVNNGSKEDLYESVNNAIFWPINLINLWLPNKYIQIIEELSYKILSYQWIDIKYIWVWWSVGRNDLKQEISDIDLVLVASTLADKKNIQSFIRNDIWNIKGVKIWLTLLNEDELVSDNLKQKTAYISRSVHLGNIKEIYNSWIFFPAIKEDDLKNIRVEKWKLYYKQTIEELKNGDPYIDIESYKHLFTCMKIYLASLWYNVEGYDKLFSYFPKISSIDLSEYWIVAMNEFVWKRPQILKVKMVEFLSILLEKSI